MESSGERTSRTTVFIVPPRNVFLEIDHQPLSGAELVRVLGHAEMTVVVSKLFFIDFAFFGCELLLTRSEEV
jgi:hypothetical protein